ncbi:hypothetical protein PO124_04475 [Bacillus licheniformis]|nr:hypothetical protein [Bacillus licheniformis]
MWREPGTGALEPWYHTPYDTIEHISKDRLKTAGQIAGTAVYNFTKKETETVLQLSCPVI